MPTLVLNNGSCSCCGTETCGCRPHAGQTDAGWSPLTNEVPAEEFLPLPGSPRSTTTPVGNAADELLPLPTRNLYVPEWSGQDGRSNLQSFVGEHSEREQQQYAANMRRLGLIDDDEDED